MSTNQKKIFVKRGYNPHEYIAYIGEDEEEIIFNVEDQISDVVRHQLRPTELGEYVTMSYFDRPTSEEEYLWVKENIHTLIDTDNSEIEFD